MKPFNPERRERKTLEVKLQGKFREPTQAEFHHFSAPLKILRREESGLFFGTIEFDLPLSNGLKFDGMFHFEGKNHADSCFCNLEIIGDGTRVNSGNYLYGVTVEADNNSREELGTLFESH